MSNLAERLNHRTFNLARDLYSMPASVPQLGNYSTDPYPKPLKHWEDSPEYAEGGIINGLGTGKSDSIAAKLPIGGAIIPADVVKMYGKNYFEKMEASVPKSSGAKDKVDAKVSNGEFLLSPEAIKFWGQETINKLINSGNESTEQPMMDEAESMPPKLGSKGYADGGGVDPNKSTRNFWRNAPQNPVPTPGRANPANPSAMMKARLGVSGLAQQAQTQALHQKMPNLGAQSANLSTLANAAPVSKLGLASNAVDSATVGNFAHDMVSKYDYQHPEYKARLQSMFPKPGYVRGGEVRTAEQEKADAEEKARFMAPADPATYIPQQSIGMQGKNLMTNTKENYRRSGLVGGFLHGGGEALKEAYRQSDNFGKAYIAGGKTVLFGEPGNVNVQQTSEQLQPNKLQPTAQATTQTPTVNPNDLAPRGMVSKLGEQFNTNNAVSKAAQVKQPQAQVNQVQSPQALGLNILGEPVQTLDNAGFYQHNFDNGQSAKILPWRPTSDDALQRTMTKEQYLAAHIPTLGASQLNEANNATRLAEVDADRYRTDTQAASETERIKAKQVDFEDKNKMNSEIGSAWDRYSYTPTAEESNNPEFMKEFERTRKLIRSYLFVHDRDNLLKMEQ